MTHHAAAAAPIDVSRVADLERLLGVARRLGATVDLDAMLAAIVDAATTLLDCERATVFLYDATADELCSRLATGIADSPITEIRFPASRGIAGDVAKTGVLVNLPDAYADARFNPDFDRASGFRTRSMLAVRLADHDDATVGVLQLLNKRTGAFDGRDEEIAGDLLCCNATALHTENLSGGSARRDLERDGIAIECRNSELCAQCCFRERHGNVDCEVLSVTSKDVVEIDVNDDVEVTNFTAVTTSTTAPLQLDALTVVDTGRNTNLDFARSLFDTTTATSSAR
jgi:transcriptional regulator with GAF, ATPase, and Fis domain